MALQIIPCSFSIPFHELDGSPEEVITNVTTGLQVRGRFICDWFYRIQLAKEFIGWTEAFGINIVVHEPHRYSGISDWLIASDVSISPMGKMNSPDGSTFATYDKAIIEVIYRVPRLVETEVYGGQISITETIRSASEFLTYRSEGLYWGTGGDKVALDGIEAPAMVHTMLEWSYNISGARSLPTALWGLAGMINDATVTSLSLGWQFPKGTLFYGNPVLSQELRLDEVVYSLALTFIYKNNGTFLSPKGWNYFPRTLPQSPSVDVSWERVTDGTNEKNYYTEAPFGDIIV